MQRSRLLGSSLVLLGCLLSAVTTPAADIMDSDSWTPSGWALGLGLDVETGEYETGQQSDFVSMFLTLDLYPTDRLDLELVVPYLVQRTEGGDRPSIFYRSAQTAGTSPVRQTRNGPGARAIAAPQEPGNGSPPPPAAPDSSEPATGDVSESGLGDISLTLGYTLLAERSFRPLVRPTLYLKLPTADEDKGLGSGAFDYGFGLTLGKWLNRWSLFGEGLYVIQGDTSKYDTRNYLSYSLSLGRQLSQRLFVAVVAQGMTTPVDEGDGVVQGRLKGVWWVKPTLSVEGYVGTALTEPGADFVSGLAVFFGF